MKRPWFSLLLAGGASVLATAGLTAAPALASPTAAASGPAPLIRHTVTGCGRPMTLYTPRTPGAGLSPSALGLPAGPRSILAKAAQRHVHWLSTLDCRARPRGEPRLDALPKAGAQSSGNWSGYADNGLASTPNYAQQEWTVPQLGAANGFGVTDTSSIWAGIGSGGGGELIQDGTEQDVTCVIVNKTSPCQRVQTDYFWAELFDNDPQQSESQQEVTNLTPNVGDSVGSAVYWSQSTGAEFTLCDFTQNTCAVGSQASPAPDNVAEWIVERTGECVDGEAVLPSLAPFGTVSISDAGFDETPLGSLEYTISSGGAPTQINMADSMDTLLAYTSGLGNSGTSFNVTWYAYGAVSTSSGC